MKTKDEIREEIERLGKELEEKRDGKNDPLIDMLGYRLWALKWVLGDE